MIFEAMLFLCFAVGISIGMAIEKCKMRARSVGEAETTDRPKKSKTVSQVSTQKALSKEKPLRKPLPPELVYVSRTGTAYHLSDCCHCVERKPGLRKLTLCKYCLQDWETGFIPTPRGRMCQQCERVRGDSS